MILDANYYKGLINTKLDQLESLYDELSKYANRVFALLDSRIPTTWEWFNHDCKKFYDLRDPKNLRDQIFTTQLNKRYEKLREDYLRLYDSEWYTQKHEYEYVDPRQDEPIGLIKSSEKEFREFYGASLVEYENFFPGDIISENEDVAYHDDDGNIEVEEAVRIGSRIINNNTRKANEYITSALQPMRKFVTMLVKYLHDLECNHPLAFEDIQNALIEECRNYHDCWQQRATSELKRNLQKLKKNRSQKFSAELWGELLQKEDNMYQLAIADKLVEEKDSFYDSLSSGSREGLQRNKDLLDCILRCSIDGEYFDFFDAITYNGLMFCLTEENIKWFTYLILRRSIITYHQFPDLREKYNDWFSPRVSAFNCAPFVQNDMKAKVASDDDAEIVSLITPMFYNNKENAQTFLANVKGLECGAITDLVIQCLQAETLNPIYKGAGAKYLGGVLIKKKIYKGSKTNWNNAIKKYVK